MDAMLTIHIVGLTEAEAEQIKATLANKGWVAEVTIKDRWP